MPSAIYTEIVDAMLDLRPLEVVECAWLRKYTPGGLERHIGKFRQVHNIDVRYYRKGGMIYLVRLPGGREGTYGK